MVNVTLRWTIIARNTGSPHDLICGVSLLDPNTGQELVMLPWWVIWNVPTGQGWNVTINASIDIPARTYLAIARAWTGYIAGTKATDLKDGSGKVVGIVYHGGTGSCNPPILDEATQTLVIGPGAVSVDIESFTISI